VRAKITDQDLTDYALDELEAPDRLYVESMLAVSEECRNDVYNIIDLAQTLEEGFERETGGGVVLCLKPDQRAHLTRPHFRARRVVRDFASAIGLAACVAFSFVQAQKFDLSNPHTTAGHMADVSSQVSKQVSKTVTQAVQTPDAVDMKAAWENLRQMASNPGNWLPVSEGMPEPPTMCTPPTFINGLEKAQLSMPEMP
jgi:anti-sigma factor RsiW